MPLVTSFLSCPFLVVLEGPLLLVGTGNCSQCQWQEPCPQSEDESCQGNGSWWYLQPSGACVVEGLGRAHPLTAQMGRWRSGKERDCPQALGNARMGVQVRRLPPHVSQLTPEMASACCSAQPSSRPL